MYCSRGVVFAASRPHKDSTSGFVMIASDSSATFCPFAEILSWVNFLSFFFPAGMSGAADIKSDRTRGITKAVLESELHKPQDDAVFCCLFTPI